MSFPKRTVVDEQKLFPTLPNNTIAPIRPANEDLWGKDGDSFFYNGTVKMNCPAGLVWNSAQKECGYSSNKPPAPKPPAPKPPAPKPPAPQPPAPKPPAPKPPAPQPPTPSTDRSDKGLKPTVITVDGVQHAYQSPANPKGLVAFLHGCVRSIYGGWPASADKRFFGMPQDVSRTKQCLKAGYAILYVGPHDMKQSCFSAKDGKDPSTVIKTIGQVRKLLGVANKPLYIGNCSAGGMIQRMVAEGKIKCDGLMNESATRADPSNKTPPSMWVVLNTKKEYDAGLGMVNQMKKLGKPAVLLKSPAKQITPAYFFDQMASISAADSVRIADSLRKSGAIDASGNIVKDIKNDKAWYNNLKNDVKIPETQLPFWNSGIVQGMLVAQGVHDAVSMYTTAYLKWAESGFKSNINDLAKQYVVDKPAFLVL